MPWTKITRCLPSVWKETRSLTKTVPDGGAGAVTSSVCCESGFMRLAGSTDQREEKRKSQRSEPTTGKPKSGQVLVRTQGGKKGRTVVAPDKAPLQPCGLFADLVKLQGCEPSTENTKNGQVLVRTRGGEKAGQWRLRKRCCRHHEGLFVDLVKLRSCNLQRKTQKADRFWFAPGKGKTEIHQLFKGNVRSSEIAAEHWRKNTKQLTQPIRSRRMGMHMRVDPAQRESATVKSEQLNPEQQERIRRRAHQIYEEHGREEGHSLNHRLQAKAEVVNRDRSLKTA